MGPLYKHEFEVAKRLGELFEDAANGITETTSGDYDFKILKELRSDYEGPVEEQPVSPEEEQIVIVFDSGRLHHGHFIRTEITENQTVRFF